jgi:hypothetical protein
MDGPSLMTLPHIGAAEARQLAAAGYAALPQLLHALCGGGGGSGGGGAQQQQQQQRQGRGGDSCSGGGGDERKRALGALERALGAAAAGEVASVCERLPRISLAWRPPRAAPVRRAPDGGGDGGGGGAGPAGEESVLLEVELTRLGGRVGGRVGGGGGSLAPRVYAPRFPKLKEEGWWLVAGAGRELLALRRVSFGGRATVRLALPKRTAGAPLGGARCHAVPAGRPLRARPSRPQPPAPSPPR